MYNDPKAVFIRTPKCAGTSIAALWPKKPVFMTYGYVPDDWQDIRSFAVIRHPSSRFLSAIRMFKFGNPDFEGHFTTPVWPDLTISEALDILEDPNIPFDRSQRFLAANLKFHILQQTHPFHCLAHADDLIRMERFSEDFENLARKYDFQNKITHTRTTTQFTDLLDFTTAEKQRFHDLFQNDYVQLGYQENSNEFSAAKPVSKSAGIWASWPAFYSTQKSGPRKRAEALPKDDIDLSLFEKEQVVGRSAGTMTIRSKDANKQFHALLPEFVGKSRLAHLLACCIVIIRKTEGSGPGLNLFHRIMDESLEHICSQMNTRWLTSITDTLADHGLNPTQKAVGLSGSILANTTKMAQTELERFYPKRPWPPKASFTRGRKLYDGVIGFGPGHVGTIINMLQRINAMSAHDRVAGRVIAEISLRLVENDTLLGRFSNLKPKSDTTNIPPKIQKEIETLLARYS